MGFAMLPEPMSPGVYVHRHAGWLVVVEYYLAFSECAFIWYKKGQRSTTLCQALPLRKDFHYLGEL